ncbi:hypothetical protein MELA_01957 [Candidatus Methylomirabilis lanthanidiphila]|uniref:Uncharacterized protein n=1 Tax=Candidatus Methylomirabilis lanthanidiphila TaxID=2211376 RepID=A0A564ZLP2_9BACT|nr:hypothetical protein [Candidatus Methylomirabilis lanthanidiphila]VUZ85572.1 hypothetical protein MELA_01957 [Candidatus Methylomirabilis lanthanidiphila]
MTVQQATAEVFLTAFNALSRQEQVVILGRIARDRKFRRLLEDISDRPVIEEERDKPSRPLRDYIKDREQREREKAVVSHKSLYSDCHSGLDPESSLSALDSRFRGNDGSRMNVKRRKIHYTRVRG